MELGELQRLEAEARRKAQEKARRVVQERQRVEDRKQLEEKIAARAFSQQFLGMLMLFVSFVASAASIDGHDTIRFF